MNKEFLEPVDSHCQRICQHGAEWKLYLELRWKTGVSQSDGVHCQAEDLDWQTRTITYLFPN
jgi:hypothetical protein